MFVEFFLLALFLILSAFFSASEMAYIISNKIKLEIKSRKNNLAAQSALYFVKRPERFFSTVLIGNNIVNIAFASISAILLSELFGWSNFLILVISTSVLLFFGELFPKYVAREISDLLFLVSAIPMRIMSIVFAPLIKITASISSILTNTKAISADNISQLFTKDDLQLLVKESQEAGNVSKSESNIIKKVMDLKDQRVYEAMRPRTEIVGVEIQSNMDEVIDTFIESGFSKLPVYEENLDNIRGFIIAYDLFKFPENLRSILREVLFVPESKKSIDMLDAFLEKGVSIAIVVDEFGGTAGIVAIEDIIEELFGEIKDEYDIEEDICKKTDNNSFIVSGKVEIDHINEKFDIHLPQGDYETIAGMISSYTGKIPLGGETITIDKYKFYIIRSNQIKIDLVKMSIT
ncbi:MAG: hemolysin family protein [Ignavibacteriaceae bacterium]